MSRTVAPIPDSPLALESRTVAPGAPTTIGEPDADTFVYVPVGTGSLSLGGATHTILARSAALVLAGEEATLTADESELDLVVTTVGAEADRHAPMGARQVVTTLDAADEQLATGARSFQILFDATNGSTRATLFAGYIPPGKAPWHYHLYDEIVWVPDGPGRLHIGDASEALDAGAAFRLRPREVHIVENPTQTEMTIIGIFTPAGSPSAAYLTPEVAAESRSAG